MEWYFVLLIAVAAVVALFAFLMFAVALLIHRTVFGNRQDKKEEYKYFTAKEFGLNVLPINVKYRGVNLSANIYCCKPPEECKKVVIFQHGFGAGTSSYMTEIAHFAKQGNAVVAADAYGCNCSKGKNIMGFYAGAEAVVAAYIGVKSQNTLKNKQVVLVGHSWGAYSVAAACKKINVGGVVAMSAFNAPAQCLCDTLKGIGAFGRFFAPLLHCWFWVINLFKFGANGNAKAAKALQKSGVKALLIHGEKDRTVPLKHSLARKAKGKNVSVHILANKKHNPYNTEEAEAKLASISSLDKEQLKSFDWTAATEEDAAVMGEIDAFIANV